jgi:hypothetical protein
MEHRCNGRRPSRAELEVRSAGRKFLAQLYDLSLTGCRFDCSGSGFCTGDRLVFRFAEHMKVKGKIAWRKGAMAGVRFLSPLPPSMAVHVSDQPGSISEAGKDEN